MWNLSWPRKYIKFRVFFLDNVLMLSSGNSTCTWGKHHHLYLVRLCLMTPTQTDMSRVKGLTKKWAKFLFPYFNWEDNSINFNELKLFWVRYIHLFSILYVNNVFLKYNASWECTLLYGNNLIKMLYQM